MKYTKKHFTPKTLSLSLLLIGLVVVGVGTKIVFFSGYKYSALLDINYVSKNENYPIDLVYLWCEDNPQRQKLRNEWKKKLGIMQNSNTNSLETTNKGRFVSNDELKYSLRSVEKYAPWINKIYIVTDDGQRPKWLNTKHPKIKIVDQKEILPKSALPSFNSMAYEVVIANIPNLSEHFLYANDDMMFANKVEPGDFFKDGKPIYILSDKMPKTLTEEENYLIAINNSYEAIKTKFGKNDFIRRAPHHNIDPYTKTNILNTNRDFKQGIEETLNSHFRSNKNLQRQIYTYYSILTGNGYYKLLNKNKHKQKPSMYTEIHDILLLPKRLDEWKPKMFCTNDSQNVTDCDRANYKGVMEKIFPDKSAFEK